MTALTLRTGAPAARVNPVAKLGAALIVSVALVLTIDVVSAFVAFALELVLMPFAGLRFRQFWLRTAPVWLAAALAGVATVLYGEDSGRLLFGGGFLTVTTGSVTLGVAVLLRVLAIGVPGVVLLATSDTTELADGLAQLVHLPSRFVLGALAALRLIALFADDWRMLGMARRARGVGGGWANRAFALLVLSVRRGTKLATAMEAKGFGGSTRRSWARPAVWGGGEWALLAVAAAIAAVAITAAVLSGSWNFVVS